MCSSAVLFRNCACTHAFSLHTVYRPSHKNTYILFVEKSMRKFLTEKHIWTITNHKTWQPQKCRRRLTLRLGSGRFFSWGQITWILLSWLHKPEIFGDHKTTSPNSLTSAFHCLTFKLKKGFSLSLSPPVFTSPLWFTLSSPSTGPLAWQLILSPHHIWPAPSRLPSSSKCRLPPNCLHPATSLIKSPGYKYEQSMLNALKEGPKHH